MDLLSAPRGELLRLIYELIEENEALKAQIAELRSRLKDQKLEKSALPSFVKPKVKKREKVERKKRTEGFVRKLDAPTEKVFHSFAVCPDCGGELGKPCVAYKRQVIEIPETYARVTEHIVYKRWCFSCKKRVSPKVNLQKGGIAIRGQRVGLNLMSRIIVLRERFRLPVRVIKLYLETFHKLHLSEGEIIALLHKMASFSKPTYQKIKEEIKGADFVCADETGHREDGDNGYLWNFSNENYQFLLYRKSRGKKVVAEVLGEDGQGFEGVLVSDFYSAYNEHAGFHQRCWAHLLRDIAEVRDNVKDPLVVEWADKVKGVYEEARGYTGPDTRLALGVQAQERIKKEREFKDKLEVICEPYASRDSPQSILCARVMKFLPELFTFVRLEGIPATNNLAERTLRHSVVQRKIFGGTRSTRGSETKAILGSILGTWNLQGLDPLQQCRLLLANSC